MFLTVVNRTNATFNLAGVLSLPPASPWRPVLVHVSGLHEALRTQVQASVEASAKSKLIAVLARGEKDVCEKALQITEAEYLAKDVPAPVVDMTVVRRPEGDKLPPPAPAKIDAVIRTDTKGTAEPAEVKGVMPTAEAPAAQAPANLDTAVGQKGLLDLVAPKP